MNLIEGIMITRIILELLAATPKLVEDVERVVAEIADDDDAEQKLRDILAALTITAQHVTAALGGKTE